VHAMKVVLLLAGGAALMSAAASERASFEFPPLLQPAIAEHHAGKVIWAELVTPDLSTAKHFYGELFGWTFQDIHAGNAEYAVARLDGAPIAGLLQRATPTGRQIQPEWLTFLSVTDARAAAREIVAHGGKQLTAPRAYRQRGVQAVYADPQGAVFAILHSHSGDPPDVLAAPGEWIWSALVTRDPGADAAFYQDVFGFDVFDVSGDSGGEHLVLSSEQYARASVNPLPQAAPTMHPHWIDFVRVTDIANTVARAQALGGRVLIEPHQDRHGGMVALLADPQGARIGVLDWSEEGAPGAAK
jgi:uncharacterized protein